MDWMIEVEGLVKTFGHLTAVDGVSFKVPKGQVLGFLGPNGAGKSTTMKMITGFMTPTAGSVRVAGHNMDAHPIAAKTQIGYLPEGAPAYPDMTPISFLNFVAASRTRPASGAWTTSSPTCIWKRSWNSPSKPCPRALNGGLA